MKIMILIGNLIAGGIERQGIHDANALSKAGYDVSLGFLKDGRYRSLVSPEVKLINFSGLTYLSSLFKITSFCRKYSIAIVISHHVILNLISVIAAKLSGCKSVVNEHGLSLNSKFRHILIRRLTYLFSDEIIAASKATLSVRHKREKLSPNRGVVVYNCFRNTNDSLIPELGKELINELHLPSDAILLGTVTRMHPIKRVDLFVDLAYSIINKYKNAYFVILGDGLLMSSIQNKVNELNLSDRVFLLGFKKNVNYYLNQIDIFALTSEIEANSLALLEAFSMKLPCLAFDVGGNSEIIKNGYNGYITEFPDVDTLAKHASLLLDNLELRNTLGENALNDAYLHFSPEVRLARMQEIISGLILLDRKE